MHRPAELQCNQEKIRGCSSVLVEFVSPNLLLMLKLLADSLNPSERERERERHTHTHTDTQTHRQRQRQTETDRERRNEWFIELGRLTMSNREVGEGRGGGESEREREREREKERERSFKLLNC